MKSFIHHEYVSIGHHNSTHRIILLHGWGADSDDLLPIGKSIIHNLSHEFEIVSLKAPDFRANGMGRQWYSLFPPDWNEAKISVGKLIDTLKWFDTQKIPLRDTVLLGFSQGAAMALDAGLRLDLGLVVSCSGYPHPEWIPSENCPVLLSHGLQDDIVPPSASREILKKLKHKKYLNVGSHEFNCAHTIHENFIDVIRIKIEEIF